MSNRGYSLVELLVTITMLGLLIGIAIPSYNSISNYIRNNQRENKIKNIEIAGKKYAFDTGELTFFVDDLVKNGYIESDDKEDNVIDPVSNEAINCYVVKVTKNDNLYDAKFQDTKSYKNGEVCDATKIENKALSNECFIYNDELDDGYNNSNNPIKVKEDKLKEVLNVDNISDISKMSWNCTNGHGETCYPTDNFEKCMTFYVNMIPVFEADCTYQVVVEEAAHAHTLSLKYRVPEGG